MTQRGDLWLVDFGHPIGSEQAGTRPAVVVSSNRLNRSRAGLVIVIPCTTAKRGLASHVEIDPRASGLDEITYAKCEDSTSVSDERLRARIGAVDEVAMFEMARAVRFLLEI